MATYDFDLITIGAGSGGVAASRRAGSLGARVALCESDRIGGTCVLRGCIPKKLLVYGSHFAEDFVDAAGFGWQVGEVRLDFARLQAEKDRYLDMLNGNYRRMLDNAGVTSIAGRARILDPHTVAVGDRQITAESILIATGGWPVRPLIPGAELAITSNEALNFKEVPRRLIVVGGGYIGVEMACIFAAFGHTLGTEVTLVMRCDRPLRGFDDEVCAHLATLLAQKGIRIITGASLTHIERAADGSLHLHTSAGEVVGDAVLLATGRAPNTSELGLEAVGVARTARGAVVVDEYSRSSVSNIYAIGDCTDRLNLTPVAVAEGRALVETLFRNNPTPIDHSRVATAVFSSPPLASVGLTEAAARVLHPAPGALEIYTSTFKPLKHGLSGRNERTFMKLVVDAPTQRVLGCHMLGPDAPEIIQGLAVALTAGATKTHFDRTIALHPTAAEEFVLMREPRKEAHGKPA